MKAKGLAHYLEGDFEAALAAYREGMKTSGDSPDRTASMSDWLYMTLRRLGRNDDLRLHRLRGRAGPA